jgi:hypothetical protein
LLDLIHEDLNRVTKKPYVELPDSDNTPDEELSKIFWEGFLARNKSIIVDLMYGQLKSTVLCLECRNYSISFDPFLTLSLPISRPESFRVGLVPYEICENYNRTEHPFFEFEINSSIKVADIKRMVFDKAGQIGGREYIPANFKMGFIKWGEMTEEYADTHQVDKIDQSSS